MRLSHVRPSLRKAAIAASAILLVTCAHPTTGPSTEERRVALVTRNVAVFNDSVIVMRFNPPPIYAMWRAEVELCSGLKRDPVDAVTYWIAPVTLLPTRQALGMYVKESRHIVLALGAEVMDWVIRHEHLHDLLSAEPRTEAHPAEFFSKKCGALVWAPRDASS